MSQKNITGSVALTKLKHVMMKAKGKSGEVEGIFIPLKANKLVRGKENAVYMNFSIMLKEDEDAYGNHGFLSYRPDMGKKWSELSEAEKEESKEISPILGNVKVWGSSGGGSSNDNSGSASNEMIDEGDDLPF